jgi:hypothetical protein
LALMAFHGVYRLFRGIRPDLLRKYQPDTSPPQS